MLKHYCSLGVKLSNFNFPTSRRDKVIVQSQETFKLISINDFFDWAMITPESVEFINIKQSLKKYLDMIYFNLNNYFKDYQDIKFDESDVLLLEKMIFNEINQLKK